MTSSTVPDLLQGAFDAYAAAQIGPLQLQLTATQASLADAQQKLTDLQSTDQTVIVSLQKQVTDLQAALAALQAKYDAYVAAHPDTPPPPPAVKVTEFKDFAQNKAGLYSASTGLAGPGVAAAVYQLTAKSSTKTDATSGATDPYYVMRFGGNDGSNIPTGLDVGGFTVNATDQGHIYGGVFVGYSQGAKVHDLLIKGFPGTSSAPPFETFSLAGWHANGMRVSNVTVDGRDSTGKPVAASLFATNSQDDVQFSNIVGQYSANGFGLTLWDSSNVTVTDADLRFNRRAINCEQPHAGVMQFTRCDMRGQVDKANPHMTFSGTRGSTKVVITDPKVDQWPLRVGVATTYQGGGETQLVSDIKLIVAGKDVTADPNFLMVGQVWGKSSTGPVGS